MFFLDNESGVDVMPTIANQKSNEVKWFTEGDNVNPESWPGQDWLNIVQAELLNVLNEAKIKPNKTELNQLSKAIKALIEANKFKIDDASSTTKGIVQLSSATDSDSETEAATPNAVKTVNDAIKNKVSAERKINNKKLDKDITLSADDIKALPAEIKTENGKPIYEVGYETNFKNGLKSNGEDVLTKADLPIGIPQPWPQAAPPTGWLKCNGWKFDKSKYPKLAAVYPSGHLPELRGEFIRGWDDGRDVDKEREILSPQGDAIRDISGSMGFTEMNNGIDVSGAFYIASNPRTPTTYRVRGDGFNPIVGFNAARVVPTANENRVRNVAFLYIVKAE